MSIQTTDTITPGVDYPFAVLLTDRPDPTLPSGPATGITNVTAYLSATETGAVLTGMSALPCAEDGTITLVDGTITAKYRAEFFGVTTVTALSTRIGRSVWLRPFIGDQPLKAKQLFVEAAP